MKDKSSNKKNTSKDNLFLIKWLSLITGTLILGGMLSFSLILISVNIIGGGSVIDPIWIVGMIPLMSLVGFPLTFIVYRQIKKNLSVLIDGMEQVANGNLETYIPTSNAKDFASVYENFNKMVSEIQSVETLRSNMVDNLSHELKTPLASINGFARILADKQLSEEKRSKYLEIIIVESDNLAAMVKNILLLSKLDAQEIITHKEEYSLTEQLQDCVICLENDWYAKSIDISADLQEVKYVGEKSLIKSLWLNLLTNAVKFTPNNGEIAVCLTEDDNVITVMVRDTGIGMSEETMKHIFEKNYQADSPLSSKGQGLGLAIVKRILKLCGGSIAVKSKEGEGSVFIVTLPK